MKLAKRVLYVLLGYVALVIAFESTMGFFQPQTDGTLVITTTDGDGNSNDRVLSQLPLDDKLYIAANHWPRAWYRQVLKNPQVTVTIDGVGKAYTAVPATPEERERLLQHRPRSALYSFLMGYAPREFLRLEPR